MLQELSIKNYIIIEQQRVTFEPGLNIITGETGSGKTMIIDALLAVAGGKLSKEEIRAGEVKVSIEALFSLEGVDYVAEILEEYGVETETDNCLIIMREVSIQGRSVCRLNGRTVSLSMLKNVAQHLLDIVGQNEHQLLFNTAKHGELLDSFGGDVIKFIKSDIKALTDKLGNLEQRLKSISGSAGERERKLDLLRYQIEEISNTVLKPNEDEELKNRRNVLINSEKLLKGLSFVFNCLYNGDGAVKSAIDLLNDSVRGLGELIFIDSSLENHKSAIEGIIYQLEDIKGVLRAYNDDIEFDDSEIDKLEERIDHINKLKRKYGNSIEEILLYMDNAASELTELINSETLSLEIEKEILETRKEYEIKAGLLSDRRKELAEDLGKLIEKELRELNMWGSRFLIKITKDENIISINGFDKIEFYLSPNPGEPEKPLCKIASGGEMSRVMLAIKNAFSEKEKAPCIIFDEIDAGVGGQTANMVGQKIKTISGASQILCITHLPQIASLSDNHIFVDKKVIDSKTYVIISILNNEEKIKEIARMLGGEKNIEASIEHAEKIIGKM